MYEAGTATDFNDLLTRLNTFLTTNGSAYGVTYAGTGNGTFTAYRGGASSVAETFTITATSSTSFTVVGSVAGSIGPATVGTPFSHAKLAFTLTAGGTAFVAGDVFTLSTAPKWIQKRGELMCIVTGSLANTGQLAAQNLVDGKQASGGSRTWDVTTSQVASAQFDFPAARTIVQYAIRSNSSTAGPKTWTFEYWTGSAWTTLDTQTNVTNWGAGEIRSFTIASPVSAARYRLNITVSQNGSTLSIAAVELRTTAGSFNTAFGQYLWQAPGNNGTDQILVGVHPFYRADIDYWDWEIAGFDGYAATTEFYAQAGFHGNVYLPLWNSSMPYWFSCNGRCVRIAAKVNGQYEVAYLGLLDPYFTPTQLAYPLAIGGSLQLGTPYYQPDWNSTSWRWSNSTNQHKAFTHSDPNTSSPSSVYQMQLHARRPDGTWDGYYAAKNDLLSNFASNEHVIWPYCGDLANLDVNLDGTYALFPVVLMSATPNSWGQLDGIAGVTGQGLSGETLLPVGPITYLVLLNITRTDRNDFFAMRLD